MNSIRKEEDRKVALKLLLGDTYERTIQDCTSQLIKKEIVTYSQSNCLLKKCNPEELITFSLSKLQDEFQALLPVTTSILKHALISSRSTKNNDHGITAAVAKLLALHSNKLSAYRHVMASILVSGGTKAHIIDMLSKTSDTVHYSTVLAKQNELAEAFITKVRHWQESNEHFCIVFDNLDKHMRSRHNDTKNRMVNMVHAVIYQSRVIPCYVSSTPKFTLNAITPQHLLPSSTDRTVIRNDLVYYLRAIIAEHIPALEWLKPSTKHMMNKHSDALSEVTKQVTFVFQPMVNILLASKSF